MRTPHRVALEIALILARLADQEELRDPGGKLVALFERCSFCQGQGANFKGGACAACDGEGAVKIPSHQN